MEQLSLKYLFDMVFFHRVKRFPKQDEIMHKTGTTCLARLEFVPGVFKLTVLSKKTKGRVTFTDG